MSKLLLNDNLKDSAVMRTSKSDEVCMYLLFSMAQNIGKHTLELVLYLCPKNITESESMDLDNIIAGSHFSPARIETAARIVIEQGAISFHSFQSVLKSV